MESSHRLASCSPVTTNNNPRACRSGVQTRVEAPSSISAENTAWIRQPLAPLAGSRHMGRLFFAYSHVAYRDTLGGSFAPSVAMPREALHCGRLCRGDCVLTWDADLKGSVLILGAANRVVVQPVSRMPSAAVNWVAASEGHRQPYTVRLTATSLSDLRSMGKASSSGIACGDTGGH